MPVAEDITVNEIYLDNSATTKPCDAAVKAVNEALTECWGNPSSLHHVGINASDVLERARGSISSLLGCGEDEIIFTSGGTESNNLAILGSAYALRRRGKRVVTTAVEHPSVYETFKRLEEEGFEVIFLPVDSYGKVSTADLKEAITPDTILVSMMLVNNEVGTIQPVREIRRIVSACSSPALIHCDAVQAFGKMNCRPSALGVDLMSISSHKIHGPKGAGALFIRKGVRILPHTRGGEQEKKIRPGTQPLPAIAGFGAAAGEIGEWRSSLDYITQLRDYMVGELKKNENIVINSPDDAFPYITGISIPGTKSEPMLNYLSAQGICISAGSACSKGRKSRVLSVMGLSPALLESPLRISFSADNTKEEIDIFLNTLNEGITKIRKR